MSMTPSVHIEFLCSFSYLNAVYAMFKLTTTLWYNIALHKNILIIWYIWAREKKRTYKVAKSQLEFRPTESNLQIAWNSHSFGCLFSLSPLKMVFVQFPFAKKTKCAICLQNSCRKWRLIGYVLRLKSPFYCQNFAFPYLFPDKKCAWHLPEGRACALKKWGHDLPRVPPLYIFTLWLRSFGLISVVLTSMMNVTSINSHLWCLTNVGHQTKPECSNCKQWACAQGVSGNIYMYHSVIW
jgi:hypothetical protein